jgi:hypothetical protein
MLNSAIQGTSYRCTRWSTHILFTKEHTKTSTWLLKLQTSYQLWLAYISAPNLSVHAWFLLTQRSLTTLWYSASVTGRFCSRSRSGKFDWYRLATLQYLKIIEYHHPALPLTNVLIPFRVTVRCVKAFPLHELLSPSLTLLLLQSLPHWLVCTLLFTNK